MQLSGDVLMFGLAAGLLDTRRAVLEHSGHRVTLVLTPADLQDALLRGDFGLLLLCHSLPVFAREAAIDLAGSRLPILALDAGTAADTSVFVTRTVFTRDGPGALVAAVDLLLLEEVQKSSRSQPQGECTMAQHEGTVRWFNNAKGYGFLGRNDGGKDVFAHYSSIQGEGYRSLKEGQPVSFDIIQGEKGPQADQVHTLGKD